MHLAPLLHLRHWRVQILVRGDEADGALCMVEHTLDAGYVMMPLRRSLRASLVAQVQEGTLTVQRGTRVHRLRAGEHLAIPRGCAHTYWNASGRTVRFREVAAPGGLERYYEELAPLLPHDGRPNPQAVFALSEPHGLEFDVESLLDIIEMHRVRLA